jgi:hypothetical protein
MTVKYVTEVEKVQGKGTTAIEDKTGAVLESEENVGEPLISEMPMANVGLTLGYTKNLGNYESAKVSVSCHIPCEIPSMDSAFTVAEEWVNDKMEKIVQDLKG